MPLFNYRAKEGPEKIIQGQIEASTKEAAIKKIEEMGYFPVKVEELLKGAPVLVSFKQIVNIPIGKNNRGILVKRVENAHIRTAVGYNDFLLCFFDPGDCQIKKYNYNSNEFSNQIKGDYHTLIVKRK